MVKILCRIFCRWLDCSAKLFGPSQNGVHEREKGRKLIKWPREDKGEFGLGTTMAGPVVPEPCVVRAAADVLGILGRMLAWTEARVA
jgi:hypothetical protein